MRHTLIVLLLLAAVPALAQGGQLHLMTPAEVTAAAGNPAIIIIDTRPALPDYLAGHAPGAVYLADAALRAPAGGVPAQLLDDPALAHLFERAGVRDSSHVVVYADAANLPSASITAYALERLGHGLVGIVNGGWPAWQAANQPVTQLYPAAAAGALTVKPASLAIGLADLVAIYRQPGVVLVDARPAALYTGERPVWQRNGHIPGAVNVDWQSLTAADNHHLFLPADRMRAIFAAQGVNPDKRVITYCGTGREASVAYHALKLLGYPNVQLYEGSWTEWAAHPELPVETAAAADSPAASVRMVDNAYRPPLLEVAAGAKVTWTNTGQRPHTVTADNGSFDSGNLPPGGSWTYTVPGGTAAGTVLYYHCRYHGQPGNGREVGAGMAGGVRVK